MRRGVPEAEEVAAVAVLCVAPIAAGEAAVVHMYGWSWKCTRTKDSTSVLAAVGFPEATSVRGALAGSVAAVLVRQLEFSVVAEEAEAEARP